MMRISRLISIITQQKIIILGLLLILVGNGFQSTFLKIQVDGVVANIGALFLFVGTLEWIFDETARRELVYEIFKSIRGDDRIHRNGLIDCLTNSREVNESEEWLSAKTLVIGIHYSSRFIEDNLELIQQRTRFKRTTIIAHVKGESPACDYLKKSGSGLSEPIESIRKLKKFVNVEFPGSPYVEIREHSRLLRYSFIYTEESIWIKFFTNSEGRARVPAFRIISKTPLFNFFEDDIRRMGIL
jgi:hypothetical protein